MAVALVGTGGLFTRIGKIGGILNTINAHRGSTMRSKVEAFSTEFDALPDEDLADNIYSNLFGYQSSASGYLSQLQTLASNIIIRMVNDDNPQPDSALFTALVELIDQMLNSSDTVNASAPSISGYTPDAGNNGDPILVFSNKTSNGKLLENLIAEDLVAICSDDAQSGGSAEGSEALSVAGEESIGDTLDFGWPAGSGASATLTTIDCTLDARDAGNMLVNSDFEDFTSNTPDNWTIQVGSAGSTVKSTTTAYDGVKALEFVGNGSELTAIYQEFDASTGTTTRLQPLTQYAVHFYARVSAGPSTGVLRVALVDGSGTVINDEAGTANSFTVDLTTIGTTYVTKSGAFRLPRVLPSVMRLQLKLSTALQTGKSMYLDHLAFAQMTQVGQGGAYMAAFAGLVPLIIGDKFVITLANTAGGFQRLFDRLFQMRQLGLLLPSNSVGGETISDSLIA